MIHPYATKAYARSLAHAGAPLPVPEWSSHVLVRPDPRDAMGPYPLTVIAPGADLAAGLERLAAAGLTSAVLVLDDRLRPPLDALEAVFDLVRVFKPHYIHDRRLGPPVYGKHHRYELKRALARVEAREIALADHLPAWIALYGQLASRHGLGGLHAFPTAHFDALAQMPGVRTFGAFVEDRLASAHLFMTHNGHAISHLAASSPEGYASGAAYAVNDLAITALADCDTINFGGGAGKGDDPADGLVRFKKGFSNTSAPSYLCGKVLDAAAYESLSAGRPREAFFPAYRAPRPQERSDADQG